MDDTLVERLRGKDCDGPAVAPIQLEAATEIERLRAVIAASTQVNTALLEQVATRRWR